MNKKFILVLSTVILLSINETGFPQIGFSPQIDSVISLCTNPVLAKLNRELSGDTSTIIGGSPYTILSRHNASVHNPKAAQFILERFQDFGLQARYMNYRTNGTNVLATKTGLRYPNRQYIICSHYDDMPSGPLAPGADDNASGTCAVLEAARLIAPFNFDYTIIFVAFDEEELGLIGSHAYADSAYNRHDSIYGVINLDMIAWDGNNDFAASIYSNSNSITFSNNTKSVINMYTPTLVPTVIVQNMTGSDHYYFWQRGYKALCGIENTSDFNPYYHTVNDNFSHVVMPFFLNFTRGAIAALMTFGWDYFMTITHIPVTTALHQVPVTATAVITSPHPVARSTNGPRLYYKVNGGALNYVNYNYNNLDTFRFTIPGQNSGSSVSYYLAAQDTLGRFVSTLPAGGRGLNPPGTISPPTLFTYSVVTGIASNNVPVQFSLEQNYPNPFNPGTNISFSLMKAADVKIAVTDILGREVRTMVNSRLNGGKYDLYLDAKELVSGIYFYTMYIDGKFFQTKKMILME
jgi:hypothetical protein